MIFKTGKKRMLKKLLDNRKIETKLRKERDKLKSELENSCTKGEFVRIWKRLRAKIQRIRLGVKEVHKAKVKEYLEERDSDDLEELSILREEMGEFAKLRIFNGESTSQKEENPL